ncbi:MAG: hypothetical protein GX616_26715 [Planctomycetes bacterium]|nr:hypothetical protein [Planctomycetota bacterium]
MRYAEMTRTTARLSMPIASFLAGHSLVGQQAGEQNPVDWLAGEFLAAADKGEEFEDWVFRQVVEILNTTLRHDTIGPECVHACHAVYGAEFDAADREYLVRVLGSHPEVLRKWHEAQGGVNVAA